MGNYCYYFEIQIAEIRESMMKNHIKTTKKVTTRSVVSLGEARSGFISCVCVCVRVCVCRGVLIFF